MSEYALTPETPDDEVVDLFGAMVEDNGLPDSLWLILADLDDLNAAELESVAKFAGPVLQVVGLLLKRITTGSSCWPGTVPGRSPAWAALLLCCRGWRTECSMSRLPCWWLLLRFYSARRDGGPTAPPPMTRFPFRRSPSHHAKFSHETSRLPVGLELPLISLRIPYTNASGFRGLRGLGNRPRRPCFMHAAVGMAWPVDSEPREGRTRGVESA